MDDARPHHERDFIFEADALKLFRLLFSGIHHETTEAAETADARSWLKAAWIPIR